MLSRLGTVDRSTLPAQQRLRISRAVPKVPNNFSASLCVPISAYFARNSAKRLLGADLYLAQIAAASLNWTVSERERFRPVCPGRGSQFRGFTGIQAPREPPGVH